MGGGGGGGVSSAQHFTVDGVHLECQKDDWEKNHKKACKAYRNTCMYVTCECTVVKRSAR